MTCWNTSLSICQPCNVTKKKGFFCVLFLEHSPLWDVTSHFNCGCVHSSHKQLQAASLDEFSFSAQKIVPASVFFCLSWRNQSDWIKRWTKIQSLSIKQFFFFSTLMFIGIFYNKAKHNTTKQQQQQQSTRLPMVTVAYYKKKNESLYLRVRQSICIFGTSYLLHFSHLLKILFTSAVVGN